MQGGGTLYQIVVIFVLGLGNSLYTDRVPFLKKKPLNSPLDFLCYLLSVRHLSILFRLMLDSVYQL